MTTQYYVAQFIWPTDDGHGSSPQTAAFSGTTIDWANQRVFLWNSTSIRGYDISTFQTFEPYASAYWPPSAPTSAAANDFLTSRGAATHDLDYGSGTLSLSSQIGTSYQPYLVSGDTNQTLYLDSDTAPTGIPATARYFLMSVWLYIGASGVWFPFQNNATPGIAVGAFASGLVRFIDASFNTSNLDYAFDASSALVLPGLNHLLVSCDTVGQTYEAVVNGIALSPAGSPHNVTTSFTIDNSGGLYVIQPDDPADTFTELWFDYPASYKSASNAGTIAKFYNSGHPVDPGTHGTTPYGTTPVGYFTVRSGTPINQTVMGCRTTPDGYILVGFASASSIYKLDPLTLASLGEFGPGSYPNGIGGTNSYDGAMAPIMVNGVPYVHVKQIVGGYSGLVRTDDMTAAGYYQQLTGGWFGNSILCAGASGTSSGSIYLSDEYDGSSGSLTLNVYKVVVAAGAETYNISSWPTQNPYVSSSHAVLTATDIDASWTTLQALSIGYDSHNNVVLLQMSQYAGSDTRLVGLDGNTLAVKWVITPFPTGWTWAPDLAQSRVAQGYLGLVSNGNFFSPKDTKLATIKTSDGSTFSTGTTYGIGTLYRSFSTDDVTGGCVLQFEWQSSVTGAPTAEPGTSDNNSPPQGMFQPLIITPTQLTLDNLQVVERPRSVDRKLRLRYSGDGGFVWSDARCQDIGEIGSYERNIAFYRLGQHRRFVAELTWSSPYFTALNGCWVEGDPAKS